MSEKFAVNAFYSCHLPDLEDGIFLFKCTARTESSITLQRPDRTEKTLAVFIASNGAEAVRPHGSCSLSPVLIAR